MQRALARRATARVAGAMTAGMTVSAFRGIAMRGAPAAAAALPAVRFPAAATALRFCAAAAAAPSATTDPRALSKVVEEASAPLYTAVSQAQHAEEVADACRTVAKVAEDITALSGDDALCAAGLRLVAAESYTQIGMLDEALAAAKAALSVFEPLGPAVASYYTTRTQCVLSRLHAMMGDRQAAVDLLDQTDVKAPFADAPLEADAFLLRAFVHNGRAALATKPNDSLAHFSDSLEALNSAIDVAQVAIADGAKPEAGGANAEQSLYVALTMRTTVLVDTATALLRMDQLDNCLKALDQAEEGVKKLPSFIEGEDHPALGDIDYHRAVVFMRRGEPTEAAAKAAVAYRIVVATMPHAVDKLAEIREMEAMALDAVGEGALALREVDSALAHINKVKTTPEMAEYVHPDMMNLALRKMLLTKLSLLDNRGEYEALLKHYESAMQGAIDGASAEARLFTMARVAQAKALSGKADEGAAAMREVLTSLATDLPERVPDMELSLAYMLAGSGASQEGADMRAAALAKNPEKVPAEEEGEWFMSAAAVAAARGDRALTDELVEKARHSMERRDFCFLAAPLLHQVGHYAEAAAKARECLQGVPAAALEGTFATPQVQRELVDAVAVAALETLREAAKGEARDAAVATVRRAVAALRKDARGRAATQYESDLNSLVHEKEE